MSAIDICVCTFRRAHIAQTLRSLATLELAPDWQVRVIVADNDETPSAEALVRSTAQNCGLNVQYVHAPARNISIARNACLDAATAPLIAFLDDDELASPTWLKSLVGELLTSNADIVLGPVKAVYGPQAPEWMREGDFHSTVPVWVNGDITTGYVGNVLMKREAVGNLRFRPELGRTGGEDTLFFATLVNTGKRISFSEAAELTEDVPAERASLSWLLRRRFRVGQTHGMLLLDTQGHSLATRTKNIALATGKALVCGAVALVHIARPNGLYFWLLRGAMHVGVVFRLLGKTELQQYG